MDAKEQSGMVVSFNAGPEEINLKISDTNTKFIWNAMIRGK